MRKSLAAIAGLVLVLGACTTAGSTDTTALEAAPEPVVAAAPETMATPPPTTTVAPTTTAPTTTTTEATPQAPAITTTEDEPNPSPTADPAPVLTEPASGPGSATAAVTGAVATTPGGSLPGIISGATVTVPFSTTSVQVDVTIVLTPSWYCSLGGLTLCGWEFHETTPWDGTFDNEWEDTNTITVSQTIPFPSTTSEETWYITYGGDDVFGPLTPTLTFLVKRGSEIGP